ncbi:MAG: DUF4328 domain-containing protein [Ilumatobacteraceae bacterium]
MSDPDPPPPPPPPDLAPPPGYASYDSGPSGVGPLRRVGGLAKWIVILLPIFAIGQVVQLAAAPWVVGSAQDLLDERISDDEFLDDYERYNLLGGIAGLATVAMVVLSVIWLFRTMKNHRDLGRSTTWAPGWAIGGWFVPPFVLYIVPLLMLREVWKASDPASPPGDQGWKRSPDNPVIWAWWVLYGIAPILFLVLGVRQQVGMTTGDADDIADAMDDRLPLLIASGVATIAAAVLWVVVVRGITGRHRRLTGEAV